MGLSERIEKNVDLSYWEGDIPVNYRFTYGLALEKFFRALKDKGELLASRCPSCGATYFPARIFCERCFAEIPRTFKVSGEGTLYSYTVCHLDMDGSPKGKPDVIGLVDIKGAGGAKFVHLLNLKPENARIGMKVKAVLKPKKERRGNIFDIKYFRPAGR